MHCATLCRKLFLGHNFVIIRSIDLKLSQVATFGLSYGSTLVQGHSCPSGTT